MTRVHWSALASATGISAFVLTACLSLGAPLPAAAQSQTPRLVPFQGRINDGSGAPLTGVHNLVFAIYDEATGGTHLWTESHTNVPVIAGQVNVLLGSLTDLDDPDDNGNVGDAIRFDGTAKPKFLGIRVGGGSAQELVPRHQLVPSFHARMADTTSEGGVGTRQLADGAVTLAKIAPEAVLPAGSIIPFGGTVAPAGWVLCDGRTLDGNDAQFLRLFQAIGLNFGGTGTQFKVPDLRGQFLRGRDGGAGNDPDAAARAGGDVVGSRQGPATISLSGGGGTGGGGSHQHGIQTFFTDFQPGSTRYGMLGGPPNATISTDSGGDHSHGVFVTVAPPVSATSTEVRPKNVAVNYICKL
jgi:Phage Tail Collar Domain